MTKKERTIFYRRAIGDCNCIILYDGKDDMLLPVSHHKPKLTKTTGRRFGYKVNVVSLSLLSDYANNFFKNGTPMIGFYKSYKSKCINKYGMEEDEIVSWVAWRSACVEFFKNILRINEREAFQCIDCGPRPKVLVIDGIAMGILKTELHKYKHEIVQELANKSKKEFEGSNFRDRMFIKQTKNRLLLRKAVKNKDWPVHEHNEENCNSDLENDPGTKRKRDFKDEGMEIFWECMNNMEKTEKPNKGLLMLMENLSTSTSTIGMMQEYDPRLFHKLELFLCGDQRYNFLSGLGGIELNMEMREKYPVMTEILEESADESGRLALPLRYQINNNKSHLLSDDLLNVESVQFRTFYL